MYLLDTNVISELRRLRPHTAVVAWISAIPAEQLFLSAITLGELQAGVEITRQQDPEKADAIEAWINTVASTHNILPVDGVIFRRWARLMHRRPPNLVEDALIAATALVHSLTVVTRNLRDFERFGIPTLNPFVRVI
ncbi:MAG TPA: type II toxin-antitoxin system VapC family toxin [Stellaceae bacterium]|nr:type II toxin-antitoxin system VapC family toxin [Stellaceae bacterium]HEX3415150.1 type II toxin-antitoxin system VapC family toxin [Stellaceae bacterium]